jgi:hypothetical protein
MQVRYECVNFLREREEEFLPFVCTDSEVYAHYLFEMRKVDCRIFNATVDVVVAAVALITNATWRGCLIDR